MGFRNAISWPMPAVSVLVKIAQLRRELNLRFILTFRLSESTIMSCRTEVRVQLDLVRCYSLVLH